MEGSFFEVKHSIFSEWHIFREEIVEVVVSQRKEYSTTVAESTKDG